MCGLTLVTTEDTVWESYSEDDEDVTKSATSKETQAPAAEPKKAPRKSQGSITSFFGKN